MPHMTALGIGIVSIDRPFVVTTLPWDERLLGDPDTGALAGGVVTTALDNASATAAAVTAGGGFGVATLDLRIDYLRPSRRGEPLMLRAECYRTTRHVAFVRAEAWHAFDVPLVVATGVGTFALVRPS